MKITETTVLPKFCNPISDELMAMTHISHQRFFHPQSGKIVHDLGCDFKHFQFQAENVSFFTPYRNFNDFALQGLGILMKPLIYGISICLYTVGIICILGRVLTLPLWVEKGKRLDDACVMGLFTLTAVSGIVHSLISMVTEPAFTAIGLFSRTISTFVSACINSVDDVKNFKDAADNYKNASTLFDDREATLPNTYGTVNQTQSEILYNSSGVSSQPTI